MSVEEAKEKLAKFSWFGLVEHMEESMRLLSYTLGLDLERYTAAFNANSYNKKLSPEAREVLESHNKKDMELYNFALDLYKERVAVMESDVDNPHYIANEFVCDKEVICWNKREGDSFPLSDFSEMTKDYDIGYRKKNMLCSPKTGCSRKVPK